MAGIRGQNTKPELLIRRALHRIGFRYRLHDRRLPGRPDISFPKHKAVVLVHGCFWHGHDCSLFKLPTTRREFWQSKINVNRQRDADVIQQLDSLGWRALVIWECALRGKHRLGLDEVLARSSKWLNSDVPTAELKESS